MEEKARQEFLDGLKKQFSKEEGSIKENLWGMKSLSYPIKRNTSGYFAHYEIETDPAIAKGLDKILKLEEDVLRHLLIRR